MSTVTTTETRVVSERCDEVYLQAWKDKVAKVNRKVIKAGLEPYRLVVTGREPRVRTTPLGTKVNWTEVHFDILGDTPSLPGWSFAATVDWEEAGCIVRTSPAWAGEPLPRPESRSCDHCGTSRYRSSTYLVAGPDGLIKQVGRQCLTTYTGIPVGWVSEVSALAEDIDSWGFISSGTITYDVRSLLRLTIALVDARGYHKAGSDNPTRRDFSTLWHGLSPYATKWERERFEELKADVKRRAKSDEQIETEVEAIIAWSQTLDDSSDYLANLRVLFAGERISEKSLGYAVSVVPTFRRNTEVQAKRKVEKAARTPLTAGRQVITGEVKSLKVVESQYGSTTKILVATDQGSAVWGTLPSALDSFDTEVVGRRLTLTAAVEVSKDDPGFGFYSRPTKASWL